VVVSAAAVVTVLTMLFPPLDIVGYGRLFGGFGFLFTLQGRYAVAVPTLIAEWVCIWVVAFALWFVVRK
jgi:hypothetical protein